MRIFQAECANDAAACSELIGSLKIFLIQLHIAHDIIISRQKLMAEFSGVKMKSEIIREGIGHGVIIPITEIEVDRIIGNVTVHTVLGNILLRDIIQITAVETDVLIN